MPTGTDRGERLKFIEIRDFKPGLWQIADYWMMPANAAQIMEDCYPQQSGGIRAFFASPEIPNTGSAKDEYPVGFMAYPAAHRTLPTVEWDYYVVTGIAGQNRKLWRMDKTNLETAWTQKLSLTAFTSPTSPPWEAMFMPYLLSDGTVKIVCSIGAHESQGGIWSAKQVDAGVAQVWAKTKAQPLGGVVTLHQDRILTAEGSTLRWTEPGAESWPADNYLKVQAAQEGSHINTVVGHAPDTLLLGRISSSWTLIQGDIENPAVRDMSPAYPTGYPGVSKPARTPEGPAFIRPGVGTFTTGLGDQFHHLDKQLTPLGAMPGVVSHGDLAFYGGYLFAPQGRVYDFSTKSWFTMSALASSWLYHPDPWQGRIISMSNSLPWTMRSTAPDENLGRVSTFKWKSAPLRDEGGREIVIREVQLVTNVHSVNASLAVTVDGVTQTATGMAAGRQHISLNFNARKPLLDVQVVSTDLTAEPPSIEVIRIGTRAGHLITGQPG